MWAPHPTSAFLDLPVDDGVCGGVDGGGGGGRVLGGGSFGIGGRCGVARFVTAEIAGPLPPALCCGGSGGGGGGGGGWGGGGGGLLVLAGNVHDVLRVAMCSK